MPKVKLVSFFGGKRCWYRSAQRLYQQALHFGEFDSLELWEPAKLFSSSVPNLSAIRNLANKYAKGFGLWSWKMPIILYELSAMDEGDVLLYVDVGCTLNSTPESKDRFHAYLDLVNTSGGLFFQQSHKEIEYSKSSLINLFSDPQVRESGQLLGGIQILKVGQEAISFAEQVIGLSFSDAGKALKDPDPTEPQHSDFIAHRHDQSIISLCAKSRQFQLLADETYFAPDWESSGKHYPIWATRLCSGDGNMKNSILQRGRRYLAARLPF